MFILRTVNTSPHRHLLARFDQITREAFSRILGVPLNDLQWRQAQLPAHAGGMGLRAALDCGAAAFSTSLCQSRQLVSQLLPSQAAQSNQIGSPPLPNSNPSQPNQVYTGEPVEQIDPDILATLSIKMSEEVSSESISNLTQKMICSKIDEANLKTFSEKMQEQGERECARLASLSLPYAGAWLNSVPLPALGLHLRSSEFITATKFRLGLQVYDYTGTCPACGRQSDVLGDHGMVCGTGGERIARHNALRDALHDTAAAAGLAPTKEGRALLPGNDRRPADVFIPGWAGGRAAALDVTVVHPLQDATRARAAVEPGYALSYAYTNKMRGTADLCDQQGIAFIPIVAESMGGLHNIAIQQLRKLGSALARHTGTDESESINHLMTRTSILLQKGLSALLLNRIPNHPAPDIGGEL